MIAVIPAAGFGTRMLPAAKAVPKELLPVLDRPALQLVVEEAADAGAGEIVLVTSKDKPSLLDHFRENPRLEERLKASGKSDLLAGLRALAARVRVSAVNQPEQRGLGDAVQCSRKAAGNGPFLCLLGDTVFSGHGPLPSRQLMEAYKRFGASIVGLEIVPPEKVDRYGIVDGKLIETGELRLKRLVEKPARHEAPSQYAVAARYLLTPAIFDCLDRTPPGRGGEVQLTDALNLLMEREPVYGVVLSAARHDIGNPLDWLLTNLAFARRDPRLWPLVEQAMRRLLESP